MEKRKYYLSELLKSGVKLALIYREDKTSKSESKSEYNKIDLSLLKGEVFEILTVDEVRELEWDISDLFTGKEISDHNGYLVAFDNGTMGVDYVEKAIKSNYAYTRVCNIDYEFMVQNAAVNQIMFVMTDKAEDYYKEVLNRDY